MKFGMYANSTGGAAVWTETVTGVKVTNGVFTVILGGGNPFPPGLVNCNYLQVSVGGTALLPRQPLTSVPFAVDSQNLAGAAASTYRDAGNLTSGYLPAARIEAGSITGAKIKNGTIDTADLANDAVTGDKIAPGTWVQGNSLVSSRPDQMLGVKNASTDDYAAALRVWASGTSGRVQGLVAQTDAGGDYSAGVEGRAGPATGIHYGVYGTVASSNPHAAGVRGEGGSNAIGVLGNTGAGSYGNGGVAGQTTSVNGGNGVIGIGEASTGDNCGVRGVTNSPTGHAPHAYCKDLGAYGLYVETGKSYFYGPVQMNDKLEVWGHASFYGGHGDLAENYRADDVEAGDVVVIGPDGKLVKCAKGCDPAVAGIVSTEPSMRLGGRIEAGDGVAPLALVGRVLCKVDARQRPVRPGDLLVSSRTPGYAMGCPTDRPKAGTVIGKALERLDKGTGLIQVLVTLR